MMVRYDLEDFVDQLEFDLRRDHEKLTPTIRNRLVKLREEAATILAGVIREEEKAVLRCARPG